MKKRKDIKVTKLISRGIDDARTVIESGEYNASDLNVIVDNTTKEVLLATGFECWKYKGEVCTYQCQGLCRNSC